MAPTRIYVRPLLAAMNSGNVLTAAHITGGGISENLPRALPAGTCAEVDLATWELPAVFRWIQSTGDIADDEMLRTFNCGVGMVLVVDQANSVTVLDQLANAGETAFPIGRIVDAPDDEPRVNYVNPW